jgi:hypothetical protein
LASFKALIVNKYYDFKDIENPLKEYIEDSVYESIDLGFSKKTKIYIRENRVTQYDSIWPWIGPKEYKFYSFSHSQGVTTNSTEDDSNNLVEFEVLMDNHIGRFWQLLAFLDIYERRVTTVIDVFSQIGGIFEIFRSFGLFLIAPINRKMFKLELFNQLKSKNHEDDAERRNKPKNNRIAHLASHQRKEDKVQYRRQDQNDDINKGGRNTKFCCFDIFWLSIP